MPHDAAGMAGMEHPTKGLGQVVTRVEDTRNEFHDEGASVFPVLDGEVLDVDVAGALSGDTRVDHVDGRLVGCFGGNPSSVMIAQR